MGSSVILSLKRCLRSALPFINQGSLAFLALRNTAHIKCSMEWSSGPKLSKNNSRQTHLQSKLKNSTVRQTKGDLWDSVADGEGKDFFLRKNPPIPKYVFAAGTAKRTAEMLKRKAGFPPEENHHEETAESTSARKGRDKFNFQESKYSTVLPCC